MSGRKGKIRILMMAVALFATAGCGGGGGGGSEGGASTDSFGSYNNAQIDPGTTQTGSEVLPPAEPPAVDVSATMPSGAARGIPDSIGFGTSTPGGRGGIVIRVNTLADNDTPLTVNADGTRSGSLRAALNHNGKRIIVFEVSGRIDLSRQLDVPYPYVTVAGQSAPPPGITLYGSGLRIGTHDVVVQHIRSRPNLNTSADHDALMIQDFNNDIRNVVIDHCSFGWSPDENVGPWASYQNGRSVSDLTINNSIVHESIRPSGQGYYGFIIGDRIKRLSAIGNLLAHNGARNPLFKGGSEGIWANNVVYNATEGAFVLFADDYANGGAKASVIGNIFKRGPSGSPSEIAWFNPNTAGKGFQVYQSDNVSKAADGSPLNLPWGGTTPSGAMVSAPPVWIDGLPLLSSAELEASVLSRVGARAKERGTAFQDANDARIIEEYRTGTGKIPAAGFYFSPPVIAGQARAFPLPADPHADPDGNGYTTVEEALYQMALAVQN